MLKRQAAFDTHGSALIGGEAGGVLLGGRRKAAKKKPAGAAKKKAAPRRKKSGMPMFHPIMGSGCGMCGACGGILEEPADIKRGEIEKKFEAVAKLVRGDFCPPYKSLLKGKSRMTNEELAQLVEEFANAKTPAAVDKWRNRVGTAAKHEADVKAVKELLGLG